MSTATQPATPKDLPDYEPLKLMPDHVAALGNRLDDWLTYISPDKKLPQEVILTCESAKAVEETLTLFLKKIKTYVSLKDRYVRHP